jgi:LysM repeat protein
MRVRLFLPISAAALLIAPAPASAFFGHVIAPGESLSSIAAADGLSVSQLAAANGLSAGAQLVAGQTIQIPPQSGGALQTAAPTTAAAGTAGTAGTAGDGDADSDDIGASSTGVVSGGGSGGSYVVQPGDTLSAIAARAGVSVASLAAANGLDPSGVLVSGTALRLSGSPSSSPSTTVRVSAPTSTGSYVVQPGDSLSAIAARSGVSVASLAASNGLNPSQPLLVGTSLRLSGTPSASASPAVAQPVGTAAQGNVTDPPYPTPEVLSASQIGNVASANGVSPSLADAIAWQESGFNNDLVSSADARGIMQILPGTWNYIQSDLNPGPALAPASAVDNVRGGVLLLRSLLGATGGDPALAAAGYYQGLPSVQAHGVFPSTQQYINSVLALRQRFGGG